MGCDGLRALNDSDDTVGSRESAHRRRPVASKQKNEARSQQSRQEEELHQNRPSTIMRTQARPTVLRGNANNTATYRIWSTRFKSQQPRRQNTTRHQAGLHKLHWLLPNKSQAKDEA